ncbi:hypothetical protein GCM10022276_12150 [Sphingomonas limnosediminicola]|uniref:UrcA family protein n=1 Tax=Sphingomonas limnosediminicola TaxID=940133 RepID=A0ABP7L5K3_9SPHN
MLKGSKDVSFSRTLIAAASLTVAVASPALSVEMQASQVAPRPPATTTINCLLVSNAYARSETNPKAKVVAQQTFYFYLGRLDPRISSQQLKIELQRTAGVVKAASAVPLMNACAQEVQAKGRMLQSVGEQLRQGK